MQPPLLFNRNRIARRLKRHIATRDRFFIDMIIADLRERLSAITRKFDKALLLAPSTNLLIPNAQTAQGEVIFEQATTLVKSDEALFFDSENFTLNSKDYDLIVSLMDMQILNDVPGFLKNAHQHLKPDGLFIGAAIGGESLKELRAAWLSADEEISGGAYGRVAPFIDIRDAGKLLQRAGFALPVADLEHMLVRYEHPIALMDELRKQGATNPMIEVPQQAASRRLLNQVINNYQRDFQDDDGRVRATLEFIWLSAWSPHESQQKPLPPGSAQTSLKQALETKKG